MDKIAAFEDDWSICPACPKVMNDYRALKFPKHIHARQLNISFLQPNESGAIHISFDGLFGLCRKNLLVKVSDHHFGVVATFCNKMQLTHTLTIMEIVNDQTRHVYSCIIYMLKVKCTIVSAARSLTCRDDLDSKWRLLLAENELSCVSLLSSISIGN